MHPANHDLKSTWKVLPLWLLAAWMGCGGDPLHEPLASQQDALVDGYNLVVTGVSPTTVVPSSAVTFSATIRNAGNVATPAGIVHGLSFWVNGTQVSWSDTYTSSIAPGGSVTLTANSGPAGTKVWTAPATAGAHALLAHVDDINRLPAETNESDNQYSAPLSVTPAAACSDRVRNGTETGVDCGPDCGPCEWPFTAVPRTTLRNSAKRVYAHWHYYPVSFDNTHPTSNDYYERGYIAVNGESGSHAAYGGMMRERPLPRLPRTETDWRLRDAKDEIELAARIGIDGFYLNLWTDSDVNNGAVWTRAKTIADAASQAGGFDIIPNFDMTILGTGSQAGDQDLMIRILGQMKGYAALLRRPDGKYVVGLFNPAAQGRTAAFYATVKQRASTELGMSLYLVPVFLGTGSTALFEEYKSVGDAYAGWGTAVPVTTTSGYSGSLKTKAAGYGKPWIHPMSSQDYRPKDKAFWEARNSLTLRSIWENVIADGLDEVQIVTWNDQHEHHNIRPSTGKQWPAYDMTAYYIQWFKTGTRPTIERDVLYYNHRIHHQSLVPTTQTSANLAVCRAGCPATNEVELVGFLTSAGRLEITQGTTTYGEDKTAGGVQAIRTALAVGTPTFRLKRSGATVVQFQSMHPIVGSIAYQDLLYRAGSSARAALPSCATSCANAEARCRLCPGEPMWLKR
ncbi:endo-1,3-alpha-glucanase family glycosylhydrolase [Corallococcus exiguus]|uniref:endo-1,3-alpha-glucanase family glycosylhydrolase n=1 Tax=Corallococcus exiguus TaxID=83462 RepID=UPI00155FD404|nr:endo-1,3-alpha-glucanase family glycosylhydrolase [Corallococcus exiguus]NRD48885.1 hypothetical protein [Corallococcus exiguus]